METAVNAINAVKQGRKALDRTEVENTHEDIEWIRKNYQFPAETTFVDENNRDYQELQLMCSCKHFILANSTFSWWAQHLSTNKESIVCAPDSWDRQFPLESEDIYENSWIIIPCY